MRRGAVVVIPSVAVGIAVVLLLSAAGPLEAGRPAAKARVREICSTLTDDPMGSEKNFEEIVSLGEEGRKALVTLASSKDVLSRCALGHLIRLEDKRAIPIIRKILNDPRADVGMREEALFAVAAFKDIASFEKVIEAFHSGNGQLASAGAHALGVLEDERGLRAMREKLADPRYPRAAIVQAIGVRGHEEAIDPLLGLVDDPILVKYEWLRSDLILSLGRIGVPRSRAAAVDLVGGIKEESLRRRIATELTGVLWGQRRASQDPAEIAEIESLVAKLQTQALESK